MDFFIEFALLGALIIGMTAFMGTISANLVKLFKRSKQKQQVMQTDHSKQGWRKLERE